MTALKKLVDQAVKNELALRDLQSQSGELSVKAYLAACAAVPGASAAGADTIEAALAGHEGPLLAASLRRMSKAIVDFKRSGPILKLAAYMDSEGDASLARLGATRQSLFLCAARRVAAMRPELFGKASKIGTTDAAIKQCMAERTELFAEIQRSWSADDVVLETDRASFRMAPQISVCDGFAERLVNLLVAEHDRAQAAPSKPVSRVAPTALEGVGRGFTQFVSGLRLP